MSSSPVSPASLTGRGERWVIAAIIAVTAWFYFYRAEAGPSNWVQKTPAGYYGLQTEAFLAGQLPIRMLPPADMLRLPDPYDPVANARYRAHDMTLYHGRYYLYFGVGPIVTLLYPWARLTHSYLTEPFATALFGLAGFLWGLRFLLEVRARYFPSARAAVLIACALALAGGNMLPMLMPGAGFYQLPMACAYFYGMLALWSVQRALMPERRRLGWMALASVAWGMAIASRPNYLFGSFILAAPFLRGIFDGSSPASFLRRVFSWLMAGVVPIALIGAGLMLYNRARFGSPWEFGMKYQLASFRIAEQRLIDPAWLWPHLKSYLFAKPVWGPWYPFLHLPHAQAPLGALVVFPFLWLAACVPLALWRGPRLRGEFLVLLAAVLAAALGALVFLGVYFAVILRYEMDFIVWLAMWACLGLFALEAALRGSPLVRAIGLALAVVTVAINLFACVGPYANTDRTPRLTRMFNLPASWLGRARGWNYGPVRMKVTFPEKPAQKREALVSTGLAVGLSDIIWVNYLPDGRMRFSFDHSGISGPAGDAVAIERGVEHEVEVFLGSFCPPKAHPFFDGWPLLGIVAVQHKLEVKVDGQIVLALAVATYDSRPGDLQLGRAERSGVKLAPFSGTIRDARRLPLRRAEFEALPLTRGEAVQMTLWFPPGRAGGSDPLFVTGSGAKSDLLYVRYLAEGKIVFGLDHFGAGGPETEVVDVDLQKPHTLTFWVGACAKPAGVPDSGKLTDHDYALMLDGRRLILVQQVYYPARLEEAIAGINLYNASTAGPMFSGRIVALKSVSAGPLAAADPGRGYGGVNLVAMFPRGMDGYAEPLVVSGVTGAGDFLYVRYVGDHAVRFGFDHWGVGGFETDPIEVDFGRPHRLELVMGSLIAPGHHGNDLLVRIKLDGKVVAETQAKCHPTTADQIRIGQNPIGGSLCRFAFTGKVLSLERTE